MLLLQILQKIVLTTFDYCNSAYCFIWVRNFVFQHKVRKLKLFEEDELDGDVARMGDMRNS